jgi:hypothetical protein
MEHVDEMMFSSDLGSFAASAAFEHEEIPHSNLHRNSAPTWHQLTTLIDSLQSLLSSLPHQPTKMKDIC